MLKNILRDPLCHFLVLGLIIYVLLNTLNPAISDSRQNLLNVSDENLITLMQQQDQAFDKVLYKTKFDALSEQARKNLVLRYVEQEVLYREAVKFGLDQNDMVQQRRLVQKMKYFLQDLSSSSEPLREHQIRDYFDSNKDRYLVPEQISFTHRFFKTDPNKPAAALARAEQSLKDLADSQTSALGDHFPFHKNYIVKTEAQISRHFGSDFSKSVFSLEQAQLGWQGPFESAYGWHLVDIKSHSASFLPAFDQVTKQVSEDAQREALALSQQQQIEQLIAQYQVVVEGENK
ncbi:MAG: hypothetical protein ACI9FR_001440 [Cryomorphaceae bacterium]|jgi:hypothetical protein